MNPQDIQPDDRETLSALFDGQLDAEARLFALRRLGHDVEWQRTCGHWQLIGDAMRRTAPIAAPVDFAGRVSAAVAIEVAPPVAASRAPDAAPLPRRRNVRWIGGGALAASIALALTVATLPLGREPVVDAATTVAAAPAARAPTTAVANAPAPTSEPLDVSAAPSRVEPAAPVSTSPQMALATPRPRRPVSVAVARDDVAPDVSQAALLVGQSGNPFNLDTDEALTTRPWPRATLGGSAFTARYGAASDSAGERPSFYPFEPRPQGEAESTPAP